MRAFLKKPWQLTSLLAPFLVLLPIAAAQGIEFSGKLKGRLVPSHASYVVPLQGASEKDMRALPATLPAGARVWVGTIESAVLAKVRLALVESAGPIPFLYADSNLDGSFQQSERYSFSRPALKEPSREGEVIIHLPLSSGIFPSYPLALRLQKGSAGSGQQVKWSLGHSFEVLAQATADIAGRKVLVEYTFNWKAGTIDPTQRWVSMDCNQDGSIDRGVYSVETALAKKETIVFKVGDLFVSTKSADLETGRFVLRSHPQSDYQRIELRVGSMLPNFAFKDFQGNSHEFAELRGKFVLLDFWAGWCGPCIAEFPRLVELYSRFKPRGLEIVGMNIDDEEKLESARRLVAEKGVTWPQAISEELNRKRFRIGALPTKILVSPRGEIIHLDGVSEPDLQGESLRKVLEDWLTKKASQTPAANLCEQ